MQKLVEAYRQYAADNILIKTPQRLYDPINYLLAMSGKQLRPALVLAAHSLYKDDLTAALPAAHAIEVFHNFTLMQIGRASCRERV